ncbi:hypothetical protein MC885_006324 [Smutsia gigantea]|nr:hypothetical protein MC885_006324 [Smutsia gigantea]
MDKYTMVKKRLSSHDTSVFRFEITGSPRQASLEARQSSTDSPSSVFLRASIRLVQTQLAVTLSTCHLLGTKNIPPLRVAVLRHDSPCSCPILA